MNKTGLPLAQRALLIASVGAVYAVNFWPSTQVRNWGLSALGHPAFVGFGGVFLPHLLFYSTLTAVVAALIWWSLVSTRILPAPQFSSVTARQLGVGVLGGLVSLIASLLFVYLLFPPGTVHWVEPMPWKVAGNAFSNFYEEWIYRGFMLVALRAAIGFWPAAVTSSVLWGCTHGQYPLSLQSLIAAVGIYFCWLVRESQSLWTPYTAHTVLDFVGDSLIG
jgi:membrane protease YdiL (CAAX protease family)